MIHTADHWKMLSTLVAKLHAELGGSLINVSTMDIIPTTNAAEAMGIVTVEDKGEMFKGGKLREGKDIRRFLFELSEELKSREDLYIWTYYNVVGDQSFIGLATQKGAA